MSVEISNEAAQAMMTMLKSVEAGTDLQNLAIINRVGMAVASSKSASTDATAVTATSSALIDLSEKMSESIQHGKLRELLVRNTTGYDVLMAVSKDLMIFCSLSNSVRIGYYLGYLRELSSKLRKAIANELPPEQLATFKKQEEERVKKEEEVIVQKPSANQDASAMKDVLGFLDSWGEREGETAITPELIAQARAVTATPGKAAPAPDLTVGIPTDLLPGKATEAPLTSMGIPDDLLGGAKAPEIPAKAPTPAPGPAKDLLEESMDFDAIIKDITAEAAAPPKSKLAEKPTSKKYGVEVYDDEVPPIPLEDLGTDNIQLLGSQAVKSEVSSPVPEEAPFVPTPEENKHPSPVTQQPKSPTPGAFEYKTFEEEHGYGDSAVYDKSGKVVDFEAADEYNFELNLNEQDAMSEALKALGWHEEKGDKKKKKQ